MKISQIAALSATLILQAQACVRVRVDRYLKGEDGIVQDMKLYDNDAPVKTLPSPKNHGTYSDATTFRLDDYIVTLRYKDNKHHPYGGNIDYPNGSWRDLQGKAYSSYVDEKGFTHDLYCFSDNYDNCGAYECGI